MLLSHRKQFIFIKTVKTAGTSVEVYFEKWCMPEGEWQESHLREEYVSNTGIIGHRGANAHTQKWHNHMSAKTVKAYISTDIWDNYFKFTIVRNPYEKVVSDFYFKKFLFDNKFANNNFFSNNVFDIKDKEVAIFHFRKWVKENLFSIDTDKFYTDKTDYMDYYIQYENLNEGMKYVCNKLSIPYEEEKIPRLKSGIRNVSVPIGAFYDNKSIEIVHNSFPWEFRKFNYRFPDTK